MSGLGELVQRLIETEVKAAVEEVRAELRQAIQAAIPWRGTAVPDRPDPIAQAIERTEQRMATPGAVARAAAVEPGAERRRPRRGPHDKAKVGDKVKGRTVVRLRDHGHRAFLRCDACGREGWRNWKDAKRHGCACAPVRGDARLAVRATICQKVLNEMLEPGQAFDLPVTARELRDLLGLQEDQRVVGAALAELANGKANPHLVVTCTAGSPLGRRSSATTRRWMIARRLLAAVPAAPDGAEQVEAQLLLFVARLVTVDDEPGPAPGEPHPMADHARRGSALWAMDLVHAWGAGPVSAQMFRDRFGRCDRTWNRLLRDMRRRLGLELPWVRLDSALDSRFIGGAVGVVFTRADLATVARLTRSLDGWLATQPPHVSVEKGAARNAAVALEVASDAESDAMERRFLRQQVGESRRLA